MGKKSDALEVPVEIVVLISANSEWKAVVSYYRDPTVQVSPFGVFFHTSLAGKNALIFQGGWGKVSAAAGTQYVIDHWQPELLINIGTCGGIEGKIENGEILLVDETLIYDIYERMGDPKKALDFYRTKLDLSFLCEPYPQKVHQGRLVSADQDIDPDLIFKLQSDHQAVAADWESGAIAWTAKQNQTRCLILRGVTDLVNSFGGEIYENSEFTHRAHVIMTPLLKALPNWVRCSSWGSFK